MEPVLPKSKPFILFPARSVMRPVVAFALYLTLNVSATGKVPVWFSLNCKYNVSLSENPAGEVGMGPYSASFSVFWLTVTLVSENFCTSVLNSLVSALKLKACATVTFVPSVSVHARMPPVVRLLPVRREPP